MTEFWALQPLKTVFKPGDTFNLSSPNAVVNILSVMFFCLLPVIKKLMPQKNTTSLITYSMIFFIILTSFLSDNFLKPPDNPSKGISGVDQDTNPYDFSRTKSEREVLTIE